MAKKNEFGFIPQRADFNLVGKLTGVGGQYFLKEGITSTKKESREMRFSVKTDLLGNIPLVMLKGYSDVDLIVYNKVAKSTIKIPFSQRKDWIDKNKNNKDYSILNGVAIKLGDMENAETLHVFDAIDEISKNIQNEDVVRIIGNIEYSSYRDKKTGSVVSKKDFVIKRIYKSEINMLDEKFIPVNDFKQSLIFKSIEPGLLTEEDKKNGEQPFYEISGFIMGLKSLDKAVFRVYNKKLATTIKKQIKENTAFSATGKIVSKLKVEEESGTDEWGETVGSYQKGKQKVKYLTIVGVDKDSLDVETFTADAISKILTNQKFYGDDKKEEEVNEIKKSNNSEADAWGDVENLDW